MLFKIKIAACQMTGQNLRHRLPNDEADCQMPWSETGGQRTKSEANCRDCSWFERRQVACQEGGDR